MSVRLGCRSRPWWRASSWVCWETIRRQAAYVSSPLVLGVGVGTHSCSLIFQTPTLPSLLRFQDGRVKLSITLHQIHLLPLRTLTSFLSVLTRYSPRLNLVLILTTASASGVLREVVPSSVMEALDMRVFEGVEGGDLWEEVIRDVSPLFLRASFYTEASL